MSTVLQKRGSGTYEVGKILESLNSPYIMKVYSYDPVTDTSFFPEIPGVLMIDIMDELSLNDILLIYIQLMEFFIESFPKLHWIQYDFGPHNIIITNQKVQLYVPQCNRVISSDYLPVIIDIDEEIDFNVSDKTAINMFKSNFSMEAENTDEDLDLDLSTLSISEVKKIGKKELLSSIFLKLTYIQETSFIGYANQAIQIMCSYLS